MATAAYRELHTLALRFMRGERSNHTLRPTELVHEVWLRLARARDLPDEDRGRFLGMAATAMRRILVDHARARAADSRDSSRSVPLLEDPEQLEEDLGIDHLDRALAELQSFDPELARMVELRFFGGLTVEDTAQAMNVSPRTVKREWRLARAWLQRKVSQVCDE